MFQNAKTKVFVQLCFKTRVLLEENKSFCSSGFFLHKKHLFLFRPRKAVSLFVRTALLFFEFFRRIPFLFFERSGSSEEHHLFSNSFSFLFFQYKLFFCAFIENKQSCGSIQKNKKNKKIHGKRPRFCFFRKERCFQKKGTVITDGVLLPALFCLGSHIFFFGAIGTIHWRSKEEQEEIGVLVFCLTNGNKPCAFE